MCLQTMSPSVSMCCFAVCILDLFTIPDLYKSCPEVQTSTQKHKLGARAVSKSNLHLLLM